MKNLFSLNNLFTKITFVAFAGAMLFITSCTKDKQQLATDETKHNYAINVDREVVNGILTFKTLDDLRNYHSELTKITQEADDSDVIFEHFESGYNSLRPIMETKELENFLQTNNGSNKTSTEIDGNFILEEVRESILNEYYEVGVGDSLYVYMSLNQQYRISPDCINDLAVLRNIEKGEDNSINPEIFKTAAVLLPSAKHTSLRAADNTVFNSCGPVEEDDSDNDNQAICRRFFITPSLSQPNCEPLQRTISLFDPHFGLFSLDPTFGCHAGTLFDREDPESVTYTFDFGDGTPTETFTRIGAHNLDLTHTYPSSGVFTLNVEIVAIDDVGGVHTESTDGFMNIQFDINIDSDAVCSNSNVTKREDHADSNFATNKRAAKCEIWFFDDFWGTHAGAKTTGYKINSNGDAEKEKGAIFVEIQLNWMEDDCSIDEADGEIDSCSNCKDKIAQKTKLFKKRQLTEDGEVESEHGFQDNGADIEAILNLQLCE